MPSRKDASLPSKTELQPLTEDDVQNDLLSSTTTKITSLDSSRSTTPVFNNSSSAQIEIDNSSHKIQYWRNHPYAVGCVGITWRDNDLFNINTSTDEENSNQLPSPCSEETDPTCGCLYLSSIICGRLGFKRIGNMVIMKEGKVVDEGNEEEGRLPRRTIDCIVGPYWPVLCFITFPLILGVSGLTAYNSVFVPGVSPLFMAVWSALTLALCYSLYSVATSDPGILPRYGTPPPGVDNRTWIWNDRSHSYIPRGSYFDPDCALVVLDFDHTCPWTGTAIGKGNMPYFQAFIVLLFICLIMDVILLTSSAII